MRKLKSIVLLILALLVCVTAFAACGDNSTDTDDTAHEHSFVDGKCECGESDPNYVPPHEHSFVDGKCECGESDPNYVPPHEHSFVDGKCECGESDPNYVPPHEHSYESSVTAPTCTEAGFTTYTCACGDTYTGDEVAAKGHTYESNVTAPTCTEAGYTIYTCSVCSDSYTGDEVAATGHSYGSEVTAPTCTEAGFTTYTCSVCSDSYTDDEVAATGHSYGSEVTAPTCTEAGYTTYTCSVCSDSYTDDEVAATGHKFIDGVCACGEEYVAPLAPWVLVTELKDGDKVLIGAAAYGKLLSAEKVSAGSYYNKGVDYSADNFDNVTDAEIFVVSVNENGEYTFTSLTGVVIALAASYSSLNADGEHKTWALTDRNDGTFLVKNIGRGMYLEWYASKNNWSAYSSASSDLFYISFYLMTGSEGEGEHVHNYISNTVAPTCTEAGYTTFTCACGDNYQEAGEAAKGHSHVPTVTAPTCEEAGYTTFTCACGDSYKEAGEAAKGHSHVPTVTAPTCTEAGYTTFTCACGDSYKEAGEEATGHTYVDGFCTCGKEDPALHTHEYNDVVTKEATCTEAGSKTPTCVCGDTLDAVEIPMLEHVDANLDITCDYEGCTKRILPPADSKVSLFTANHMIIVSLSSNYYVEGTVIEITDAKNGCFIIEDEDGYTILIRLPKNADGVAYSSFTEGKVVVGDTVSVYGKPAKNSSAPTTEKAKVESGILTITKHEHKFSEATCVKDSVCLCGKVGTEALGHSDEDNSGLCDRCDWNMNLKVENIVIATDTTLSGGVVDDQKTFWTWTGEDFDAVISKGTSTVTLYTTAKAYMQLKKQNTFTLTNKNGATIDYVVIKTTNATQLTNLVNAIGEQFEFTSNEEELSVTIKLGTTGNFTFNNVSSSTAYISGIEVVYEKAN